MKITRRLYRYAAVAASVLSIGCSSTVSTPPPGPTATNAPAGPPIQHVIVVVQENRSFNMMFRNFPGAETSTTGACKEFTPPSGGKTYCKGGQIITLKGIHLATGPSGGGKDIEHGYRAFFVSADKDPKTGQYLMDGFDGLLSGTVGTGQWAGTYPYSYVVQGDIQPYWDMAKQYALADHMFTTAKTDSFVSHQELVAATSELNAHESVVDVPSNRPWGCDAPTGTVTSLLTDQGKLLSQKGPFPCFTWGSMADVLDAAGVSWKYYVQSLDPSSPYFEWSGQVWDAFDAIKKVRNSSDWNNVVNPNVAVLSDIQKGRLPQVSWVIPRVGASDHPASGDNKGPSWVSSIVNEVGKSQYWKNTAIVVLWDDWGGWYDPVPPPQLDYVSLGMRIPMIVISPYAKAHYVSKTQYEEGSVLKFIEQNFGTGSLGKTDARANSIVDMFDFKQKPIAFKPIAAPFSKAQLLRMAPSKGWDHESGFGD